MTRCLTTKLALVAAGLTCLATAREAEASGFAIRENSAEALGTAFAGSGSSATFLSTIFNNPAGMTHFTGDRAQIDGSLIIPTIKFKGSASETFLTGGGPVTLPISGDNGGDAGETAFVPAAYLLHSFSPDFKFGLALTAPFGLSTLYDSTWVGRFFGIKSYIETIDINPNLAYRVNNWLSIGAGVSAQYLEADLTSAIDFNSLLGFPPSPAGPLTDGLFRVHGNDWGVGYNAGVLVEPWEGTNLGLTYRSRIDHTVGAKADFNNVPLAISGNPALGPAFTSSHAQAHVTLPDSVGLSVTQRITDKLHVAADVQWTDWSLFKDLTVQRTNGAVIATTPEHFQNTIFAALGATYNLNDTWTLRTGVAYDESAVTDRFRTVRLPDADRYWFALGFSYKIEEGFSIDGGYAHILLADVNLNSSVNSTQASPFGVGSDTIRGSYSSSIDLVSLGVRFKF